MKIFKKIFAVSLVAALLVMNVRSAYADALSDPKAAAQQAMQGIMQMFGTNQAEVQNLVQTANVYSQKGTPPQVALTFTPDNPTPGEKVTATAAPSYFYNDASRLYYTWYIKHNNGDGIKSEYDPFFGKNIDCDGKGNCDLNNDGQIDIEDYKIEAMRTMVNGGFDWNTVLGTDSPNCSTSSANNPSYCTQNDMYNSSNNSNFDEKKAGYQAAWGGDDQRGKNAHCFVQNVQTGNQYEINCDQHLFPSAPKDTTGDGHFTLNEEKFWHTDPSASDTSGAGTVDEATVAGLGKNAFSWNYQPGDQVGVVVEGVSPAATQNADSSYRTMFAMPNGVCTDSGGNNLVDNVPLTGKSTNTSETIDPLSGERIDAVATTNLFKQSDTEYLQKTGVLFEHYPAQTGGSTYDEMVKDSSNIVKLYENLPSQPQYYANSTDTALTDITNGSDFENPLYVTNNKDFTFTDAHNNTVSVTAGEQVASFKIMTVTGYPTNPTSKAKPSSIYVELDQDSNGNITTSYYKDQPNYPSSLASAAKDPNPVYNYSPVDVANDGSSDPIPQNPFPTDISDPSTYQTYTDVNGNTVKYTIDTDASTGDSIITFKRDNPFSSVVANLKGKISKVSDLNKCLESNLIAPGQGDKNKKLDVTLSYTPNSPVDDETDSGSNADTLMVQSSILDSEDENFINYNWHVYLGSSIGTENWAELLKSDLTDQTGIKQVSGLGMRNLNLKLNFKKDFLSDSRFGISGDTFYMKITLDATENASGGIKKSGIGSVIIPIQLSKTQIRVFPTQVSSSQDISLDQSSEMCNTGMDSVVCPVSQDEIVGIKTDFDPNDYDLLWTLDGEPLPFAGNCATSGSCDSGKNYSNENFFAVTKEVGAKYTVTLEADKKDGGERTTLTKVFQVEEPTVSIVSADQNTSRPELLGNYVDLNNKLWPDYSTNSFDALQGSTVTLKPVFNTSFYNNYTWFIDGTALTADNAAALGVTINQDGTISFPANKQIGDDYNISISTVYTQSNDVKKALNKIWNIPLDGFHEKEIGSSIDIKVVGTLTDANGKIVGTVMQKKVLASIFSEIPSYMNFLFRVLLTIGLILFTAGILFSLFPRQEGNYLE